MFYSLNTFAASRIAKRHIDDNAANANTTIGKISSGSRHTKPSIDTSGLVVSNKTRTSIAALQEAQRNISKASSLMQVAAHGYQEATGVIARMRQLAVLVVNDAITSIERGYANEEYRQLVEQLDATAEMTRFSGRSLLTGGVSSVEINNASNSARLNSTTADTGASTFNDGVDTTHFTATTVLNTDLSSGNFTLTLDAADNILVHEEGDAFAVILKDGDRVFRTNEFDSTEDSQLLLTEVGNRANVLALNYVAGNTPLDNAADIKTELETLFNVNNTGSDFTIETTHQGFTGQIDHLASRGFIQHQFDIGSAIDLEVEAGFVILKIDGETFKGQAFPQPNGRLSLQSEDNAENLISFIYAGDVSAIDTDRTFEGHLRDMLSEAELNIGAEVNLSGVRDISDTTTISAFDALDPLNKALSSGVVVGEVATAADIRVADSDVGKYTVEIIIENETFRARQVAVEDSGVLTLTSISNSGNSLSLNYSGNTSGLTDAASFKSQLERFLNVGVPNESAATFTVGERQSAYGLNADQTAFSPSLNVTYSSGLIDGIASGLEITRHGALYDIKMTVGGQEFVEDSYIPENGVLTLVSNSDPRNVIALDVLDAGQFTSVEQFQSIFASFLGIDENAAPARFRSDNGYNHTHNSFRMGIDASLTSSSATAPGVYGFSYDANRQIFHLSGNQSFESHHYSDLNVNERGEIMLLFDNGLTLSVGTLTAPFDPDVSISHTLIEVNAQETLDMELQVSNDVADEMSFSMPPATSEALGLAETVIAFKDDARIAEDRLSAALETIGTALAATAAQQAKLEILRHNSIQLIEGNVALKGIHADIDMGEEITNFTTQQTLTQSSVSMLSQANSIPETLLRLLP